MRKAGIREARQNLSSLIEDVKKGREIVITDRGRPVARLVPPARRSASPFPDLALFRRTMPVLTPPLSGSIVEDGGDRF
jgi:prevent-host-death family protein